MVTVHCTSIRMKILLQLFFLYISVWQPVTAFTWKIYFWLKLSWDRGKGTRLISHTRASQCDILQHINGCDKPRHKKVKNMKENSCFMSYLLRITQSTVYKDPIIMTSTSFCGDLAHSDSSMSYNKCMYYNKQCSLNFCHKEDLHLQLF